ncbi:MAG: hypothetical protein AAF654_11545 [Myxococcota bacterium]
MTDTLEIKSRAEHFMVPTYAQAPFVVSHGEQRFLDLQQNAGVDWQTVHATVSTWVRAIRVKDPAAPVARLIVTVGFGPGNRGTFASES